MDLYARVNILGGRAVRLPHGDVREAVALDADPVARARNWVALGADYLHVVDLDAAAYGDYRNRDLIDRIVSEVDAPIEVAGGIRSHVEAARLLEQGAWRIVMGTAAIEDQNMVWELCRQFPSKVAVSLDVRADGEVATRGWTQNSGRYLEEVLIEMSSAGAAALLVSEAGRDALVEAPNFHLLLESLSTIEDPVIASGGVRNLDDLRRLIRLHANGRHLAGVVVGREVTEGRFTIQEAKEIMANGGSVNPPGPVVGARTVIRVSDMDRSIDFYEGVLGFRRISSLHDGVVLEINDGATLEITVDLTAIGGSDLVCQVEDVQGWHDHLVAAGIKVASPLAGSGARRFAVADPDGVAVHFTERV